PEHSSARAASRRSTTRQDAKARRPYCDSLQVIRSVPGFVQRVGGALMLVRVVTFGVVFAMVGCGDDSAPGNGDAGRDAPPGMDSMGDAPSPGACNPVTQDCPSGQRCTLNHNLPINTTFCEQGSGPQSEFMMCDPNSSTDNCTLGTVCLGVNATTRVCRRFCDNDTNCGTNVCAISIGANNGPLHACAQRCQVLMQNCTISGESCYLGLNTSNQPTQQCSRTG